MDSQKIMIYGGAVAILLIVVIVIVVMAKEKFSITTPPICENAPSELVFGRYSQVPQYLQREIMLMDSSSIDSIQNTMMDIVVQRNMINSMPPIPGYSDPSLQQDQQTLDRAFCKGRSIIGKHFFPYSSPPPDWNPVPVSEY